MPSRRRTSTFLLAVAASAVTLAAPAPSDAATGWRCSAEALTGSVLGQSIPGVVRTGSTTEDCKTGQAVQPLSVPPLLDLGTLAVSTTAAPKSIVASGGIADLAIHLTPGLPITLPPVEIPASLTNIELKGLPVLGDVRVDLTPAVQQLLPNRQLPSTDLVNVRGAVAFAGGQCTDGKAVLGGAAQVGGISVLGQELGTGSLIDRTLTLLDSGNVDLGNLDFKLAEVTVGGVTQPIGTNPLLQPVITALKGLGLPTSIAVPATLARVKITPGEQITGPKALVQRALRIEASVAGVSIADLSVGQAAVGDAGVRCEAGEVAPEAQTAPELALACTKRKIVLIDVLRRGRRVKLIGAADKRFVGRTVKLVFAVGHRTVARAKVRKDGSFSTTAPLPAAKVRGTNRARYRAVLGKERSLNLKLTRRMVVTSVRSAKGRVRIRGRVVGPLAVPRQRIVVKRRVTCRKTVTVARVRPDARGRFSVRVKAPKNRAAAVYRLSTRVRNKPDKPKLYPTFTLPRAVDL